MDAVLHLYVLVAFLSICQDKAEPQIPQAKIEELIQRRNLRSVGYTHFDVSHLHDTGADDSYPANLVNSDLLRRRKRDINSTDTNPSTTFRLEAHGNSFSFSVVHTRPALHPDGIVRFSSGDTSRIWQGTSQDCFMTGKLTSHDAQTAVFSFCDNLKGYFSDTNSTYWVESLEYYDRSGDSPSRMLVAKKPNIPYPSTSKFVKRDVGDRRAVINKIKNQGKTRQKRQALQTFSMDIELAVVVDELATAYYSTQGARSDAEKVELMQLKWIGVQAEYAKFDELVVFGGLYDFENTKISLKAIEFHDTNPAWLNPDTVLLNYLQDVCPGLYNNNKYREYDHIQLITGLTNTSPNGGVSPIGGVCSTDEKCSVVATPDITSYWVPAHEMGHNLNLVHDYEKTASPSDAECLDKAFDGIMGSEYKGWSKCSGEDMVLFLVGGGGQCLFTADVADASAIDLANVWPGMKYSDHEVCALKYADGWEYRPNPPNSPTACSYYTCINMNLGSDSYGTMLGIGWSWTINGRSCGDDMYCYVNLDSASNVCITWADTGLPDSVKVVVPGGWSAWGPETSCSRNCGTGTTFKKRKCNNPKPMFSPWCEGSEYEATLCETDPCLGDSTTESDLIIQRASETCNTLVSQNLIPESEKFATTGIKYSNAAHGQCEVKCDLLDPAVTSTTSRFGLMPDGTPCTDDSLDDIQETFQMVRSSGKTAKCLQGYCQVFGCDNKYGTTIKQRDGCGVCGGTNYVCDIFEGVFSEDLTNGERRDLMIIPSGATLIQFWFKYNDNKKHWLELWSTGVSEEAIIASKISGDSQITDNRDNPKDFAGTAWTYVQSAQYLSAPGPTNEDVKIKVYYTGSGSNSGINWAYSIPKDVSTTAEPTTPEPTTPEPTTPEPTTPEPTTDSQQPTTRLSKKERKEQREKEKQRRKEEKQRRKEEKQRRKEENQRRKEEKRKEKEEKKLQKQREKEKKKQEKLKQKEEKQKLKEQKRKEKLEALERKRQEKQARKELKTDLKEKKKIAMNLRKTKQDKAKLEKILQEIRELQELLKTPRE